MTEPERGAAVPRATGVATAITPPSAVAPSFDPGRLAGVTAIVAREIRGRMRGKRAFFFLTFYLSLLAIILWLALRTTETRSLSAFDSISIGRGIFAGVILVETLVVVALAPAYTAGAISSEREKQTYDLLAVTPISSMAIVVGKLLSGLSYLALIVFASFPIACLAFMFGGISPDDLIRGYLVLVATGIGIGAIGVWCSAAVSRTQTATVAAFVLTAMLVVGGSAFWLALDARGEGRSPDRPPQALLLTNPFIAQFDVICQATGDTCFAQQAATPRNVDPATGMRFDENGNPVVNPIGEAGDAQPGVPARLAGGSFWPVAVLTYLGLGALGMVGASQSLSPTRRWRPTPRTPAGEATEVGSDG